MSQILPYETRSTVPFVLMTDSCYRGDLSQAEASEILGMSERTFRRWRERYEAEGAEGLYDRCLGRVSARRAPVDEVMRVLELFETRYPDFTAKHFHEKLVCEHRTHPGKVEAPYTVCIAFASNLTGLVKSSVECRRIGLWNPSMYPAMAVSCLSSLHPHPLGLEWAQTGYRGARHGCSRPRRSPIPAFATRVPATFPR